MIIITTVNAIVIIHIVVVGTGGFVCAYTSAYCFCFLLSSSNEGDYERGWVSKNCKNMVATDNLDTIGKLLSN